MFKKFREAKNTVTKYMLLLIGVLMLTLQASAQYAGYKSISDLAAFKKQFATESAKVQSITSDFVQQKELLALTETITSSGKFWFKRSNRVRIDYTKPFTYRMVMNGDKMLVKDDQKESRINVKSNKLFQQVNKIMIDCVQGTILDSKEFTTRVFENDKTYLLEMTPVSKTLKEFFQTIVLSVEKKDYSVKSIDMNEPSGDKTTITFSNKVLNAQVADEIFAL
jgi:outer membrane lipoprotein-sorting protein